MLQSIHFAALLDVQNILSADTGISWRSPDQCVSQCYAIECDRSFYCALFCAFMTRVKVPFMALCKSIIIMDQFSWKSELALNI
jgi:hypothetical protein